MRILPKEHQQIPLFMKYDIEPVWPEMQRTLGLDKTGCIIAIALFEASMISNGEISYSRRKEWYREHRNNPLLSYHRVVSAVNHLESSGWIHHYRQSPGGFGWQSAMSAKSALLDAVRSIVEWQPRLPLILPRMGILLRDHEGKPLDLAKTRAVSRMNRAVLAVNEAISSVDVRAENGVPLACPMLRIFDGVPGRGVAWGRPHAFRRQSEPVMFRAQPRA